MTIEVPTLPQLVDRWAAKRPDDTFVHEIETGASMTFSAVRDRSRRWSAAFARAGIGEGDRVVTMLYPCNEGVCIWNGLGQIGAIDVGINIDYRGALLRYVVQQSRAKMIVLLREFAPRLEEVKADLDPSLRVLVLDEEGAVDAFLEGADDVDPVETHHWDISCIIYTSGTTGPSKGVLIPWAQIHATAEGTFPLQTAVDHERYYSPFAMFHMSGRLPVYAMALCGGTVVMRQRLSLTSYWDDVTTHACTSTICAAPLIDERLAAPPGPDDPKLPVRRMVGGPLPRNIMEFSKRFDVQVNTAFNMTEISCPLVKMGDITDPASCGRLREGYPGYDVRVVDENDQPVPPGVLGELIVRTSIPWTLNAGYDGMPDKTAEAWRNGWFHTGDAFTYDEDGNYFYRDRFKDAIRRRGENISSFEVEMHINEHPEVVESAAVGVRSPREGEEIKVCVVRSEGSALDAEELIRFLIPRMPRFMVPRYVEFVDELPKTEATMRVRKHLLRENALNDATWDRDAAGIEVPR